MQFYNKLVKMVEDQCQCTVCGEYFIDGDSFDFHKVGSYPKYKIIDPEKKIIQETLGTRKCLDSDFMVRHNWSAEKVRYGTKVKRYLNNQVLEKA